MPSTVVTWTFAPQWLTPAEASALMGRGYSEQALQALIELGAVDARQDDDGQWHIEKRSLYEYREALWEVTEDAHQW